MAYTPHVWISRLGTALNRFLKQNETATHVELVNEPTEITEPGTSINVGWLNEIEQGIVDAHNIADGNTASITTINGQITEIQGDLSFTIRNVSIPASGWVDNVSSVGFWTFDYSDARITADAFGSVNFDKADGASATADGIIQQNDTFAGSIRIYSTQQPANDYTVDIFIGGQ